jgi:hypothetical protein
MRIRNRLGDLAARLKAPSTPAFTAHDPFYMDDDGVVRESIQWCTGDDGIAKDVAHALWRNSWRAGGRNYAMPLINLALALALRHRILRIIACSNEHSGQFHRVKMKVLIRIST